MSNENLVTIYLGKEDEDLKFKLKGLDNKGKAEIAKKALRVYLANEKPLMARITSAPGKPWVAVKGAKKK